MPDITMCVNSACPIKETCYRFKAKPSEYQSMAHFEPDADGSCYNFIKFHSIRIEEYPK